jgi:MoaA/NifB/PqqE/SkfB family radical SAM enzyme
VVERKYDIEAQWMVNLICDYSCEYCFSSAPKDPSLVGKLSPRAYADFFDSTGKTWLLHLSGGEPFAYHGLVELCAALARNHLLSINSNLTSKRVRAFAQAVDPQRVEYIHCGVHPEEREKRNGWRTLAANLQTLAQAGFPVFASCVMTPAAFALFEGASERLDTVEVPLIPKALRGLYRGRRYPQSYSGQEREQFLRFSELAERKIRDCRLAPLRNDPTVNPLVDRYLLQGAPDFTGVRCSAGRKIVTIAPDGNIYACSATGWIGNIFRRRLKLYSTDQPCHSEWRHYACVRYSAVDAEHVQSLPLMPVEMPLKTQVAGLIHIAQRGAVNTLVRLSLP